MPTIWLHAGTVLDVADFLRSLGIEVFSPKVIAGIMALPLLCHALLRVPLLPVKEIVW